MTGWAKTVPDGERRTRNRYIAVTAALHAIGRADGSPPPRPGSGGDSRHVDQRASPRGGSRRSAHSREVLVSPGFHDAEELLTDGAVIQHATGAI